MELEDDSRKTAIFDLDEPRFFVGTILVQILLSIFLLPIGLPHHEPRSQSCCRIEISEASVTIRGRSGSSGFLGLSETVPVGYQGIRVYFTIDADISVDQKKNLFVWPKKYSPVFNTITKCPFQWP